MFLRRKHRIEPTPVPRGKWESDMKLVQWSQHDHWTLRDALEGTLILGGTGSGKTSGSGRMLAMSMLTAGFGGTVLTVKPDETDLWRGYCERAGRLDDLIVIGADRARRFNFLNHELSRRGGGGHTENIVALFSAALEVADRSGGGGGGREDEGYWRRACRQLVRNAVEVLILATGRVSVPDLYRVIVSAPNSYDQMRSEAWQSSSPCLQMLKAAEAAAKNASQDADLAIAKDFFLGELPGLSDKTRSVITSTFTSMIDVINRGLLRDIFCADTNVTPDAAEDGRIIVIDLPLKSYGELGLFAQVLWKQSFQRSLEGRQGGSDLRPVFLWADEAHYFVTSQDMLFQTTARSAKLATVLLSQNVSNFHAALGGSEKGQTESASLFANLSSKFFHAQADPVTNEWAAKLIGRRRQVMANGSSSSPAADRWSAMLGFVPGHGNASTSAGFSETYEFDVQPHEFSKLRTGGERNGWRVDGILFQNGKTFDNRRTWRPVIFNQRG